MSSEWMSGLKDFEYNPSQDTLAKAIEYFIRYHPEHIKDVDVFRVAMMDDDVPTIQETINAFFPLMNDIRRIRSARKRVEL